MLNMQDVYKNIILSHFSTVFFWQLQSVRYTPHFNPLTAKLFNCNFHPLQVVCR